MTHAKLAALSPPTRRPGLLLCCLAAAALGACGASDTLTGSVSQYRDLSFDSVAISATSGSLIIEYVRQPGNQLSARLAIDSAADPNLAAGMPTYIGGTSFANNVKLTRVPTPPADGTTATDILPEINSGSITLTQASLKVGAPVAGSFGILLKTLVTAKDTIPAGYTLNGTFSGTVTTAR